jgi:hypothetical protein
MASSSRFAVSDSLTHLLVDEDEVGRALVAEALEPYVRLTRGGGISPLPLFDELVAEQKVLVALLSFRAMHLLGMRETQGTRPAHIAEVTGVPPGTVRPALQRLARKRMAAKAGNDYVVPLHASQRAITALKEPRGR